MSVFFQRVLLLARSLEFVITLQARVFFSSTPSWIFVWWITVSMAVLHCKASSSDLGHRTTIHPWLSEESTRYMGDSNFRSWSTKGFQGTFVLWNAAFTEPSIFSRPAKTRLDHINTDVQKYRVRWTNKRKRKTYPFEFCMFRPCSSRYWTRSVPPWCQMPAQSIA